MFDNLHLIRPLWLLALLPLGWLAWQVCRPRSGDNAWQRIVDARLLPLLMIGPTQTVQRSVLGLVGFGWLVGTLALADPTWERKPQPVFQTRAARVVVLDLSSSMNATDLKPSRLVRARYKVEDVLALGAEGQTGLVVYAGDAYTVTPLTRDANTIRSQLDALAPDLMPSDGSRADLGLLKAGELLHQAGVAGGQVLLIADAIVPHALAATRQAAAQLKRDGYRVSVLAVGAADASATSAGATGLRSIAEAGDGVDIAGGAGIEGLRAWVDSHEPAQATGTPGSNATVQAWVEQGPWLVLLLVPIAALAFRRNWLLSLMLLPLLSLQPHDAMAASWDDLWQRPEQQAARSLSAGDYARAARLASDAQRRGSAEYKRGNYQQALDDFSHASGAEADYNRGNALARLGRYPDAIAAYDQTLKADPGHADARANKAAVQALLKQQQDGQAPSQQPQPSRGPGAKGAARQGAAVQGGGQGSSGGPAPAGTPGAQGKQGKQGMEGGQASQGRDGKPSPPTPQTGAPNAPASPAEGKGGSGTESKDTEGGEKPGPANASAPTPPATGHEFADAARQLAKPGAQSPAQGGSSAGDRGGMPAGQAQPAARARSGAASSDSAQPLPTEEQLAAEQWLRRIPDDPGGLLRRKFLYQYRQRAQQAPDDSP